VLVPLSRPAEGAGGLPGFEDGRALVPICRSGHRPRQAARLLAGRDLPAVDVMGGTYARVADGPPIKDIGGAAGTVI
jgi:rhodanese-related sulfurtransferase